MTELQPTPHDHARPTVMQLANAWQAHLAQQAPREWHSPLTGTHVGQLKRLKKLLGAEALDVIAWTVDHWGKFTLQVRCEAGLQCAPTKPKLGFLVAHVATAVNMTRKAAGPPQPHGGRAELAQGGTADKAQPWQLIAPAEMGSDEQTRAPQPLPPEPEVPVVLTADMLATMLAELNE